MMLANLKTHADLKILADLEKRLRQDRGSVTIVAAFILPVLIGIAALVIEFGGGLLTRVESQRVADLAAFAAATAYSSGNDAAKMTAVAKKVGALNGVAAASVSAALATSPRASGNQTVKVTVTTSNPLLLAGVLGFKTPLAISAAAYAEIAADAAGCIIALSKSGTGVTLSGGTKITAPNCAVASNVSVAVPCGTTIMAKAVSYFSAAPSQPCSGISAPAGSALKIVQKETTDPLAAESAVTTARARLATVAAQTAPAAPAGPVVTAGTDIDFGYNTNSDTTPGSTKYQAKAAGCAATNSGSAWTVTCPASATPYRFGKFTMQGGTTVSFAPGGATSNTYNFSEAIATSGGVTMSFGPGAYNLAKGVAASASISFGAGTYNIGLLPAATCAGGYSVCLTASGAMTFGAGAFTMAGGIYTAGSTNTTFGAGTFTLGAATGNCEAGAGYSICHNGATLTFGGPSTFVMSGGIFNKGGSTLTLGSGSTNSYDIGASAAGDSINVGGGAKTSFADATSGLFRLSGNLNAANAGGSCMTLPAAAQHDIKGYLSSAGGNTLGAGVYTVGGYVAFGANQGGDVSCNGATVGVKGVGVTLAIGAATTPGSGSCSGQAFCLAAGYGNVSLTAPTSGATAKLVVVGPASLTAGATFAEGNSTSLSGAFYFPKGPISMSGGASLGNGTGECLQIVGSQVTLSGGTAAGSLCFTSATAGGAGVSLVQ